MKELVQLWFEQSIYGVAFLKPLRRHNIISFQYQDFNDRFSQFLGQSSPDFTKASPVTSLSFISAGALNELLCTTLKEGKPYQKEYHQETKGQWITLTILRISRHQLAIQLIERSGEAITDVPQPTGDSSTTFVANDLIELNQLLQAVIDSSPVGLALLRPIYENGHIVDFRYLLSNPQNVLLTGLSQQVMLTNSLLSLFPNLLTNGIFAKLIAVIESDTSQHFELQDEIKTSKIWGSFSLRRVGGDILFTVQDITRLKQVEAELRKVNTVLEQRVSERTAELYRVNALQQAILKYAGLGLVATDTQGIIQLVNPAMEKLSGYQADELVGKVSPRFLRDLPTFDRQVGQLRPLIGDQSLTDDQTIMAYVNQHEFLQRENTLLTKTGQKIPVYSTVSGLYNEQNSLLGYVDLSTDISTLKNTEEALLKEQYRTRLAIKAGKLGIWEWNLLTDTLTLDEQFYTYFSLLERNCLQRIDDILLLTHQDDVSLIHQAINSIRNGQDSVELRFRIILPNSQTTHFIKVDGVRYQSESQSDQRIIGVVIDQTSIQQAEFALQKSEKLYRLLVDNLKEVVFQADTSGCWTFLNQSWEEITGFSVEESLGTWFLDYVLPDDRAQNMDLFEPLIARRKSYCQHEVRYIHKGGGYRWIEVVAQVTVNEQDEMTGITGTLTDITDRKLAAEALAETLKKEQSLNALKSQFISVASHQFRTPLASIQSSIDLIQFYLQDYTESVKINKVQKLTSQISQQILSLEELILDTLTLSKLEDGKVEVKLKKTDLLPLVKDLITLSFSNRADGRQVLLTQRGEPAPIYVDTKLIRHVLGNLLTNAFKFSSTNPKVDLAFTEKTVCITVSDQGIGIPAKDLPNIFSKFFRASNTGQIEGTGLGLAICREYIRLQNGQIEVESEEVMGSTFKITLPILIDPLHSAFN